MTPGDPLHQPGKEYILAAASLEQARLTYAFIREALEPTGQYRWIDSTTRLGATHVATNTKLRAISSNAKTSFGLVGIPIVVLDEPGALETIGGQMLADSLFSALGKPGSALQVVLCGTLAPMATGSGHWWFDLVEAGTTGSTYVMKYQGDPKTWDRWGTISRCNPLAEISPAFRKKLLAERDAARRDSRLKARFLSYRLNVPSGDESTVLLTTEDWERVVARPVPPRRGRPIFAYDLAGGRAWSAAVALYRNGRTECLAVAPGIPSLQDQEKRDRVPAGLYSKLAASGRLLIADGLHVPPPSFLHGAAIAEWGGPELIYCDRFRLPELADTVGGSKLVPRVTRWSESSDDIRGLRSLSADGPLSVEPGSRSLLAASLAVALVKTDDAGSVRLVKRGSNNTARDDVAAALLLAAGALARLIRRPKVPTWRYRGAA